jgi:hypothetical protein
MNWKLLMMSLGQTPVYFAPADDEGGGAAPEDTDEPETDDDDEEEEDSDDDSDDDEDEDPDGDGEDDEDDDDSDGDSGKGAQKRIRQLNERKNAAEERVKTLEKELDEAKKLSGDDGRAILAAAEASGILPSLMTKAEAEAFQDMADLPQVIEMYRDWLDEHGSEDELDIGGGRTMSYGAVRKRVRKLEAQLDDLKDRYGDRRRELQKKVRGIFELGLKAQEAGWSPDSKKKPAKKTERKKLHDKPVGKKKPAAKSGKKENWGDIGDEKDFVRMIAASNKED